MFANVYFVPAVWLVLTIAALFFIRWLVFYVMDKTSTGSSEELAPVKKFINVATFVVLAVIVFFSVVSLIKTVSVNEVPRSVIDRSNVIKQQQQLERAVRKESGQ